MNTNSALIDNAKSYYDFNSLQQLKHEGFKQEDNNKALEQAAQQFEAVFLQMVLGAMRQSNEAFNSEYFNTDAQQFYQEMHDQQLALHLSQQKGVGLAPIIVKQLQQNNAYQATNNETAINSYSENQNRDE